MSPCDVFTLVCVCGVLVSARSFTRFGSAFGKQLFEGDVCFLHQRGTTGICQRAENCPSGFSRYRRPSICSFDGYRPIVCCRKSNSAASSSRSQPFNIGKSEQACQQNQKLLCNKFQFVGLQAIVGGIAAAPKEYPHMALIGYGKESSISWLCGGSLISDRYILSAAHCTEPGAGVGPPRWVRLGDLNIATETDDAKPQQFAIESRINHPDYKPPLLYNDIALYKLNRTVTFNRYVSPVCLQSLTQPNVKGTAIGWGRTEAAGPRSNHLMKVDISLVSQEECAKRILPDTRLPRGIEEESMICAGETRGNRDTCQGDSGGPLMLQKPTRGCVSQQIGITSFGRICGQESSPGVYTRVSKFIPWIESIVWP